MTYQPRRLNATRALSLVVVTVLVAVGLAACGSQPPADPNAATPPNGTGDIGQKPTNEEPVTPEQTDGTATAEPDTEPKPEPAKEDCVAYDPANLTITANGDAWLLKDGSHALKIFDTWADAHNGRQVARNWTRMCFIGRANTNPDRNRYIITYWRVPSGLPLGPAPTLECVTYDPTKLAIYGAAAHPANPDQSEWALHSGATPLLFLATQPDALRATIVASEHTQLCFIGHGNTRPDPYRYVVESWRG